MSRGVHTFTIGDLEEEQLADLMPILRWWIRKDGQVIEAEVDEMVRMFRDGLSGRSGHVYLTALNQEGKAIAVMGFGPVHPDMAGYRSAPDAKAAGLVTVYTSPDDRGKGLGKAMLKVLFNRAKQAGWTEMIWSSNPRYRETAWAFYTGIAGEPVGMIAGFFAEGVQSPVWRKSIDAFTEETFHENKQP